MTYRHLIACSITFFVMIFISVGASAKDMVDADGPSIAVSSPLWRTPPTERSLLSGGLALEPSSLGEGPVAVFTGDAPAAMVSRPLKLKPGAPYCLRLKLRRQNFVNEHYLWLNLWGTEHRLDTHCVVGGWQEVQVKGQAPNNGIGVISIRNFVASRFLLSQARLEVCSKIDSRRHSAPWPDAPFPWGVYLHSSLNMDAAASLGFNLVLVGAEPNALEDLLTQAHKLNLRVILYASPDTKRLLALVNGLERISVPLRPVGLYLVDEPAIRSFSPTRLLAVRKLIKSKIPWAQVVTAMVRPQEVARYAGVYDAVFMDQYPIPRQPINWLADSVRMARVQMGSSGQVWAVAQGFGGGRYLEMGWPRLPTSQEITALCFSALVSGAQGLLIYRWDDFINDQPLKNTIRGLRDRLLKLQLWLPLRPGLPGGMKLQHLGRVQRDPGGGPAVRTGWSRGREGPLVMAVNTTPYNVAIAISGLRGPSRNLWTGKELNNPGGELRCLLEPLGMRTWLLPESRK